MKALLLAVWVFPGTHGASRAAGNKKGNTETRATYRKVSVPEGAPVLRFCMILFAH